MRLVKVWRVFRQCEHCGGEFPASVGLYHAIQKPRLDPARQLTMDEFLQTTRRISYCGPISRYKQAAIVEDLLPDEKRVGRLTDWAFEHGCYLVWDEAKSYGVIKRHHSHETLLRGTIDALDRHLLADRYHDTESVLQAP